MRSLIFLFLFTAGIAHANPDAKFPRSPQILDDGRVAFRYQSSSAEEVSVVSDAVPGGKAGLRKGDKNIWEYITPEAVAANVYSYSFRVDGNYVLDPHNRQFKKWRKTANQFVVPGKGEAANLWDATDVPHGSVEKIFYQSQSLQTQREAFVYLPPGYNQGDQSFPVLWLLHGSGDDASAWTQVGRANFIADNLIAQGRMTACVIVMPYGHGNLPGVDPYAIEDKDAWFRANSQAVQEDFTKDLMPLVQKRYRVSLDPKNRAVAGLSMGGGQALGYGLNHPEVFGWVLGFSSGTPGNEELAKEYFGEIDADAERQLVWIACGKDDFLLERNHFFRKWLTKKGIEHEWHLTEGSHSWPVWRDYLIQTLPRLFQED